MTLWEWLGPLLLLVGCTPGTVWAVHTLWRSHTYTRQRDMQRVREAESKRLDAQHEREKLVRRRQERAQVVFELSVADLLLAADRFTVHPEFVRLWRNGQSLEWLLNSEERREFVDALGLPFDSLERPTPAQRAAQPRGRVVEQSQPEPQALSERGCKQCAEHGVEVISSYSGEVLRILSHAHNGSTIARVQPERPSVGAREAVAIGNVVNVSRAQYDELRVKDPRTFYRITDALKPTMLMRTADYEALVREAKERR